MILIFRFAAPGSYFVVVVELGKRIVPRILPAKAYGNPNLDPPLQAVIRIG
jgi:hypothetical protein